MTMRTVRLYGVLRKRFGREFPLEVSSPQEAISALCYMLPGFEKFLRSAEERGLVFAVFAGSRNLGKQDIALDTADASDIRIAPLVVGSKQAGLFQTILGVVLVVVGSVMTGGAAFPVLAAGVGMALGGVMQMMSPTATGNKGREDEGNRASYAFGGATTTVAQGNPWPLLYGEREIGGAVLSGGIYAQDQV